MQLTSLATEAAGFLWAPDGRAVLVLSDVDPACGADMACNEKKDAAAEGGPHRADRLLFRHWNEWRDRKRSHVLLVAPGAAPVDLTPGDRDVPPAQRGDAGDLAVTPDGKGLLFVAMTDPVEATSTNGDLFTVPLAVPSPPPRPAASPPDRASTAARATPPTASGWPGSPSRGPATSRTSGASWWPAPTPRPRRTSPPPTTARCARPPGPAPTGSST